MDEFTEKPSAAREMSTPAARAPYEPPRVERLVTHEDLEREMLHGIVPISPVG